LAEIQSGSGFDLYVWIGFQRRLGSVLVCGAPAPSWGAIEIPSSESETMRDIEEKKVIVQRFLDEAYNRGNLTVGDEWLSSEAVMYSPSGDMIEGIEGWRQYAQVFLTALSDINLTVEDTIAEEDTVVVRWKITAKHTGDLRGIPPTNKQLTLRGVAIYRFDDGKMVEIWGFQDRLGLMQQLGVIPS